MTWASVAAGTEGRDELRAYSSAAARAVLGNVVISAVASDRNALSRTMSFASSARSASSTVSRMCATMPSQYRSNAGETGDEPVKRRSPAAIPQTWAA